MFGNPRDTDSNGSTQMFLRMRLKITGMATGFVTLVLVIVSAIFVFNSYQTAIGQASEQLRAAQISSFEHYHEMNSLGVRYESSTQTFGQGGDYMQQIPVITYVMERGGNRFLPLDTMVAELTPKAVEYFSSNVSDLSRGFHKDEDSGVYYLLSDTDEGTFIALTNSESIEAPVDRYANAFTVLVTAVTVLFLGAAWFMSNWIVAPAREAWSKQRQFIADASHELKTPVSIIVANSSVLLGKSDDPEVGKWTKSSLMEAERLSGLIEELLYLATNESEKRSEWEEVDLCREAARVSMSFESRAFENGNELSYPDMEGAPAVVSGDKAALKKLVSILVDNACKYAYPGTPIDVEVSCNKKTVELSVTNTGDELSDEDARRVFDRFYRRDASRSTEGYGLGLAMAKNITEAHSGKITARSRGGETTFFVEFPPSQGKGN